MGGLPTAPAAAGRIRDDRGQGGVEYIGVIGIVALVVATALTAVSANAPVIGDNIARLVCQVLTAGTGDCGGPGPAQTREPLTPCLVYGESDTINAGIDFAIVSVGGNRTFSWEELSDGTYRVRQLSGSDVQATTGIGGQLAFVVADTEVGFGASAGLSGGVTFQGGQEWLADSAEERDRLISAENWDRFDTAVGSMNPLYGPTVRWLRDSLGIGESFPAPDTVYVAGGLTAEAGAYAGAQGVAVAQASAGTSRLLGYREDRTTGERTFYYETTMEAEAMAGAFDIGGNQGASLSGEVQTMVSITVDESGTITQASHSGLATGESAGLTNVLFGGDPTASTSDSVATGTQYDATLPIRTDADRQALAALVASTGIDLVAAGTGLPQPPDFAVAPTTDPLFGAFMAAVRDRGDLTRTVVTPDGSTLAGVNASLEAGVVAGISGDYSTASMAYSNPEYWDGTGFVPRTNC